MDHRALAFAAVFVVALPAYSQPRPVPAADPRGAEVFARECATCHGPDAEGGEGPSLMNPVWRHGSDHESLLRSVRGGYPPAMPTFGQTLPDADITAVVSYLEAKRARVGERRSQRNSGADKIPGGVVNTVAADFRVEAIGRMNAPYGFDFLPDGRILVTEIAGALRVIEKGQLLAQPVQGAPTGDLASIPKTVALRRGLLDVIVHPDYARNGWIYLLTARGAPERGAGSITLTVNRGRIRDSRWVDSQALLNIPVTKVNALRMAFDAQNHLYFGTGWSDHDYLVGSGGPELSQDLTNPEGKLLRMNDDGTVPADNPFVGKAGAYPYIWSYGHREPLGLAFDAKGELWESEDGPRGGDEVNHIRKGLNYGWPEVTWGHRYDAKPIPGYPDRPDAQQPVVSFAPSPAVSAIAFYHGTAFPGWNGSLFLGSLKQRDLFRIVLDGDRPVLQEVVLHDADRLRAIKVGPDGCLYVLTDGGLLLRLVPAKP